MLVKKQKSAAKKEREEKKGAGNSIKFNKNIVKLAEGFTVKRIISMIGMMGIKPLEKEEILAINAKLNKIKKK